MAKRQSPFRVECAQCGATDLFMPGSLTAGWTPVHAQAEAKGWSGLRARPLCPLCTASANRSATSPTTKPPACAARPAMTQENTMGTNPAGSKAETAQVREPSLAETATIFKKLDEVFERGRYLDRWSDRKVGEALNLPWALVAKVREQLLGPLKEDPAITALRSEVEQLEEMVLEVKEKLRVMSAAA
ncbi:hypothetical protein J2847_005852 [Azospirillum agricola]|uniref:hypothetical protein n=1 Tax=Azospirillum agricola TaxID=1720247 RepID=UPI001AE21460|nr:hypothetical protein [Azospirillum agricola]MBP2232523.1 hypothetical protein [Azospirillum agricola]